MPAVSARGHRGAPLFRESLNGATSQIRLPAPDTLTFKPTAWKEYQEATAAYYRELGLSAQTDFRVVGARGKHAVDVAVRGHRAGVDFFWIVECQVVGSASNQSSGTHVVGRHARRRCR